MFKRILVPLDGSIRAERAIPVAARIARNTGGSITLVRVVSTSIEYWPYLAPGPTLAQTAIDGDLEEASKYLAGIAALPDLHDLATETMVLFGPTASTILSVAYSQNADVIVMCSHGYTGATRWIMGSVAEKVAHHSAVPVFIIREGGPLPIGSSPEAIHPFRALVPLDGSARANAVIEPAAYLVSALAAPAQGALHLLRVVKPLPKGLVGRDIPESEKEQGLQKAKEHLSSTLEQIREGHIASPVGTLNLAMTWSVAVDEDVAHAIVRVAENGEDVEGAGTFGGCDVVVMTTHGQGGLQHWVIGSITERVLNATKLPLLIVRPPDMIDKNTMRIDKACVSTLHK